MTKMKLTSFKEIWYRLPEYVKNLKLEVQALDVNKVAVGKVTCKMDGVNTGTPLVVGDKYVTTGVTPGDDFTNVGWVSDGVSFIATGTTPTHWTNTNLNKVTESLNLFYNDIDVNLSCNFNALQNSGEIVVTNNSFIANKTYPVIESVTSTVIDSNTLRGNQPFNDLYFKIEVYN